MNSGNVSIYMPDPNWFQALAKYEQPSLRKALAQLLDTCLPSLALWGLMVYMIHQGYASWMTLAVAVPAAGLFVRLFILFHDCCHGSFFASRQANSILGHIVGIVTFTHYSKWRRSHAGHHATGRINLSMFSRTLCYHFLRDARHHINATERGSPNLHILTRHRMLRRLPAFA
jgi:fatty acid desaturase